ncbi:hypothetical protein DFH07DRAFT_784355 [Mycena maculata]|uniref:Carbohydrate-binding module family 19 domain-containing protein n=1 Tax=Mycena maculata TaxID=230809 RepID=A0AAD7HIF6_9AGAR|nr:hypothetical protein DFH07DRAFT_784355 [Mycena maculata]
MFFSTIFLALTAFVAHAAPIHPLDKRIQLTFGQSTVTPFTTLAAAASNTPQTSTAVTSIAVAPSAATSTVAVAAPTSAASAVSPSASSSADFHLQNGLAAQKLNAQFQTLTTNSSCTEGEQACVGTSFAQCVSGTLRLHPTGATGGVDGSSQSDPSASASADAAAESDCGDDASSTEAPTATAAAPTSSAIGFKAQNGLDAQKLNAQFQNLTATSPCAEGEEACVGTSFAQCVSGAFVLTSCSAGTICAALPLVNSPGTSIACDASTDVATRIAAAGVVGGITGLQS